MRCLRLVLLAAGLLLLVACSGDEPDTGAQSTAAPSADAAPFTARAVTLDPEGAEPVELCLLVADTQPLRSRGLSARDTLGPWDGMLFEFDSADTHSFWMRDTHIPLDLVPIREDDTLGAPLAMDTCPDGDCPIYRPDFTYERAIELAQGRLRDLGLDPADGAVTVDEGGSCAASG